MPEQTITVKGEGVYDHPVADMIAVLSGFPEGSNVFRIKNIYDRAINSEYMVGFHKKTLDDCGDDNPFVLGPDFVVIQIYRPPVPGTGEQDWQPTDNYKISYNERVDPACFSRLEEEIAKKYAEMAASKA